MSGGSSGGGSQNSSTVNKQEPWAPSMPYLERGMQDAAKLYSQGPAQYTPWGQVAEFSPLQTNAMNGITSYINSPGTQNFMNQATNTAQGLMNGQNSVSDMAQYGANRLAGYVSNNNLMDTGNAVNQMAYGDNTNPYLKTQVNGALQTLSNNFLTNTLPGLRRQAIGDGSYGSSRNEMMEGQALAGLDNQLQQTASQMYQNDYNTQERNRMTALGQASDYLNNQAQFQSNLIGQGAQQYLNNIQTGLGNYTSTVGMPLTMIDQLMQVGNQKYTQTQNQLNDATNRWNFNQNNAWDNLTKFKQLIDPAASYGGSTSGSSNVTNTLPTSNTAGNVLGGLLQAGALYGQLKGGGAGNLFSSGGGGTVNGINMNNTSLNNLGSMVKF